MNIIWEKSTNIIKEKISQQNFETWIRPMNIVSVEGSNIHFTVPNKFFKDWISDHYIPIIKETLNAVTSVDYNIDFIVKNDDGQAGTGPGKKAARSIALKDIRPGATMKNLPTLNPNYCFERFVVGSSNQLAHAAALAVAERPGKSYNPLFIYGGVGLGKTHLLNAIGMQSLVLYPAMNVVYVSSEEFMNELINSIRYDKMQMFREKYRNIDCLLIDDIQFIAGKERTQEEFFHTFNTLHDTGRQIVVTSDKFPKDIPNLENRLRSRFEWGLIADIQPPEVETKMAIIEKKAQESNVHLPQNVSHFIASSAESNIRELEGFLVRISAYASLTGRTIDLELVKEVLKKIMRQNEKAEITIEDIIKTVTGHFGLKLSDIKSQKKNKNLVLARQVSMFLARKLTDASFPDIGEKIGGRDHSTVIYANNKIKKQLSTDEKLRQAMDSIEKTLKNL
ncbi:MAG: chromosomal replication initiator protein DnaA [Deltaproteobacteria bacterium]|nr:chromosomal replication initiator protein DnaA [Deltaproteobacteria bacterium]